MLKTREMITRGWFPMKKTGKDIAVSYDKKHAPLIAAAPSLLEALKQIIWKLNRNEKTPEYSGPARITRDDITIKNAERLIYETEDV